MLGLAQWKTYTHEEVLEAIRFLSLDSQKYCQDYEKVTKCFIFKDFTKPHTPFL